VTRLTVVGDALLDRDHDGVAERLCPEAPVPVVEDVTSRARPGGAGLAAVLAAAGACETVLVTALARDAAGRELEALLGEAGIRVVDLGLAGPTQQKVRVRAEGRLVVRVDHGGRTPAAVGPACREAKQALAESDAILVADYGRGVADRLRTQLASTAEQIIWDPHPRGRRPVPGVALATPNRVEAGITDAAQGAERAEALRVAWRARALAITLGGRGAVLAEDDAEPLHVPVCAVEGGDPCGAGDRFAVTAAEIIAAGRSAAEAVAEAVQAASSFVAAGGAGSLARARGGIVVATGGCFDLLHAGHVATIEAARALGDYLVVLVNSDESVRRLKGADRPLQPQHDRVAVLQALSAVDEVVVFDEDTPVQALERLRPDVFVKGGDYERADLPETAVLETWGGRVAIVPYVPGRSTTRLIAELARVA
jgi:rfaE bifunctional protein nucleotidyltransferase chain/domain/rfaE bifunctional protein kinase chain/domain